MIEFFPRRYYVDERGRRVLIGLSAEETVEFEKLDELPPLIDAGHVAWSDKGAMTSIHEKRWFELYIKHDAAWTSWAAENVAAPRASAAQME
jgi:hypothetical protein